MRRRHLPTSVRSLLATILLCSYAAVAAADSADHEQFEKQIRPLLAQRCFKCHSAGAKRLEGGLFLDSRAGMLTGGDTGPAVVPGKLDDSRIIQAIRYDDVALQMPPEGKLPAAEIALLERWVEQGAGWPASVDAKTDRARATFDLAARKRAHWAWQPVSDAAVPHVKKTDWPLGDVDRFVLAKLEAAGLEPAPAAEAGPLARRLSYALTGLPPDADELQRFTADASPQAYEQLVDRLLASPAFGEHWARHWLDLMRYGESRGHEFDYTIPNAWQYRDYVIRALNADLPYDQFVREHLAGDLLAKPRMTADGRTNESILATGFWFLGEWVHSPVDLRKDEADRFDNAIDVFSKSFLGLTVSCARCHDHKFDAISTKDYYALFGFLRSTHFRLAAFDTEANHRQVAAKLDDLARRQEPRLTRALADAIEPQVDSVADYLLAAREVLRAAGESDWTVTRAEDEPASDQWRLNDAFRPRVQAVAAVHGLDASRLARWSEHLRQVEKQPSDPLHVWALLAAERSSEEPEKWQSLVAGQLARWQPLSAAAREAARHGRPVADYAHLPIGHWLQDGFAFGSQPAEAGEIRVLGTRAEPRIEIAPFAAARHDAIWDRLQGAADAENESGRLNGWLRTGRTLYTQTFTLDAGKLHYLVRGKAHVYAEVDSHRMNNGPLHAGMLKTIDTKDAWRWIEHDLRHYRGHRLHVEFTPESQATFELSQIVAADVPPPRLDLRPNGLLVELLEHESASSATLAAGYERLLADVLSRWRAGTLSTESHDAAALLAWLNQTRLFVPMSDPSQQPVERIARDWANERERISEELAPPMRLAMATLDGTAQDQPVLIRGNPATPGAVVERRFLEAIAGADQPPIKSGSGRLELAERVLDPADPFVSRVIVNRLWHHLFGRGIVPSVDNFGVLGEAPSHPELLDYLAARMVREGWSLKRMIKLLVMSQTFRMSSSPANRAAEERDPSNALLHRMPLVRLSGESIRDAMLAVSGRLDRRMGGPSVPVHLTSFLEGRGRPAESGPLDGAGRRSIYIAVRRNFLSPMMLAFDTPSPFATFGRRNVSNVPAQALILLNDPLVIEQARFWARRLGKEVPEPERRIGRMYLEALGRPPTADEVRAAREFVASQQTLRRERSPAQADELAWADLCHVVFNLKEFIFVP